MSTSSIGAAVDYLVTACTTALGTTAHVFDGPPVGDTQLQLDDRIWIGYSPVSPDLPAATGDQQFAALGARSREETVAIVCAVEHFSGTTAMRLLRDGAFALLATVETLLRGTGGNPGDCTLGGAVLFAQLSGGIEVHQAQTPAGASVLIQFHVQCRARLT
ncbi:hypothetical protein P3T36_006898 [Kitasatospora sp. MAP12-15]|uniref:hypothetical protein n=1 Tax=unclassified Kitasatospora TaxID=2633591 RepID=UPI0024746E43|nr:hypothetical protein [Kitasatospora sp. MAP12-44]MDH6111919.1 hypothetical protein [Kitasatospora sp. MAP12-44]